MLIPIPAEDLPRMVGKPIHLACKRAGCVYILERIEGDRIHVITPMSGVRSIRRAVDACYTRKHEPPTTQYAAEHAEYARQFDAEQATHGEAT